MVDQYGVPLMWSAQSEFPRWPKSYSASGRPWHGWTVSPAMSSWSDLETSIVPVHLGGLRSPGLSAPSFPGDREWSFLLNKNKPIPRNLSSRIGAGNALGLGVGSTSGIGPYDRTYGSLEGFFPSLRTPVSIPRGPGYVGYDVQFREHAGSLIAEYQFIPRIDSSKSQYMGQNVSILKYGDLSMNRPSVVMNDFEGVLTWDFIADIGGSNPSPSYNTTKLSEGEQVLHQGGTEGSSFTVPIQSNMSRVSVTPTDKTAYNFKLGEFYLLQDNPVAIRRVNLAFDIIRDDGTGLPLGSVGADGLVSYPADIIKWRLGYGTVPEVDFRTDISWSSLGDMCSSWVTISDKFDLSQFMKEQGQRFNSGQYVIQIMCDIDPVALSSYLEEVATSGVPRSTDCSYSIVIYPPSLYTYPSDMVTTLVEPYSSSVSRGFSEIIFKPAFNYKSGGNIQYVLEFLTGSNTEDILFTSASSLAMDPDNLTSANLMHEPGSWFHSMDNGVSWTEMQSSVPGFDNTYQEADGSDAEQSVLIKYVMSEEARNKISGRAEVVFGIKQVDGTLIPPHP